MMFAPIFKSVVENSEFSWLGRFVFPGIFDGEHIFSISVDQSSSVLVQKEKFKGVLVSLLWSSVDRDMRAGFERMNAALKARAESENS
ncbi:SRPBCC domain-containing protein [Marinomonas mediterranea]|uniref:SRPBCC domain-containing protein n=1 Tax=Marinomonas mediterranea TaxID=119864 RepID=UPI00234B1243|nr:SRPBCC domain-containing protein [Marinomonas mediterranea]